MSFSFRSSFFELKVAKVSDLKSSRSGVSVANCDYELSCGVTVVASL